MEGQLRVSNTNINWQLSEQITDFSLVIKRQCSHYVGVSQEGGKSLPTIPSSEFMILYNGLDLSPLGF